MEVECACDGVTSAQMHAFSELLDACYAHFGKQASVVELRTDSGRGFFVFSWLAPLPVLPAGGKVLTVSLREVIGGARSKLAEAQLPCSARSSACLDDMVLARRALVLCAPRRVREGVFVVAQDTFKPRIVLLAQARGAPPPLDPVAPVPRLDIVLGVKSAAVGGAAAASAFSKRRRLDVSRARASVESLLDTVSLMVPQFELPEGNQTREERSAFLRYAGVHDMDSPLGKAERELFVDKFPLKRSNPNAMPAKAFLQMITPFPTVLATYNRVVTLAKDVREAGIWCCAYWSGGKGFRLLVLDQRLFFKVSNNADFRAKVTREIFPAFLRANRVFSYEAEMSDDAIHRRESGIRPDVVCRSHGLFPRLLVSSEGPTGDEEAARWPVDAPELNPKLRWHIAHFWSELMAMAQSREVVGLPVQRCATLLVKPNIVDISKGRVKNTADVRRRVTEFCAAVGTRDILRPLSAQLRRLGRQTHQVQTSEVCYYYEIKDRALDRLYEYMRGEPRNQLPLSECIGKMELTRLVVDIDGVNALLPRGHERPAILYQLQMKLRELLEAEDAEGQARLRALVCGRPDTTQRLHVTWPDLVLEPAAAKLLMREVLEALRGEGWEPGWVDLNPLHGSLRMPLCPKHDRKGGEIEGPATAYYPAAVLDHDCALRWLGKENAHPPMHPLTEETVRKQVVRVFNLYNDLPRPFSQVSVAWEACRMAMASPTATQTTATVHLPLLKHFQRLFARQKAAEERFQNSTAAVPSGGYGTTIKWSGTSQRELALRAVQTFVRKKIREEKGVNYRWEPDDSCRFKRIEPNVYMISTKKMYCLSNDGVHSKGSDKCSFIVDLNGRKCHQFCHSEACRANKLVTPSDRTLWFEVERVNGSSTSK